MHGKRQHTGARRGIGNAACGLNAVQLRHGDIHNHDIGQKSRGLLNGFAAVSDLADHLKIVLRVENHAKTAAHHGMVIGEQNANPLSWHGPPWGNGGEQ